MTSNITNIQRFSLNDGPGIRTTIFFQGCNMHCTWCHNPETFCAHPVLMQYQNKCIGCGKCFEICPQKAHKMTSAGSHFIDRSLCVSCGKCAENCYADALVMSSQPYTVEQVMKEVLQDKLYYDLSGGGVTVSGGEATLHADFISELADECHKHGIQIACETNMSLPYHRIEGMLKKMDLIMCDLKIIDSPTHKKFTGIDNQMIFNNIGRSSRLGIPMIVRTPLIPGATDDIANIRGVAEYIAKMDNIRYLELLNFNPLGNTKHVALDTPDPFEDCKPFSKKQLDEMVAALSDIKVQVKVS